jgi:hypothetical protein
VTWQQLPRPAPGEGPLREEDAARFPLVDIRGRALHAGLRSRQHVAGLPGHPGIVLPRFKT